MTDDGEQLHFNGVGRYDRSSQHMVWRLTAVFVAGTLLLGAAIAPRRPQTRNT